MIKAQNVSESDLGLALALLLTLMMIIPHVVAVETEQHGWTNDLSKVCLWLVTTPQLLDCIWFEEIVPHAVAGCADLSYSAQGKWLQHAERPSSPLLVMMVYILTRLIAVCPMHKLPYGRKVFVVLLEPIIT